MLLRVLLRLLVPICLIAQDDAAGKSRALGYDPRR